MDKYYARGPAESLIANPTSHLGMAYHHTFLSDLLAVSVNVRALVSPYHRSYSRYIQHASVNARRLRLDRRPTPGAIETRPDENPATAPGGAYKDDPDIVTAERAFGYLNRSGSLTYMAEDLKQEAWLKLQGHSADPEKLRIEIAKNAMSSVRRREEVRERSRVSDPAYAIAGRETDPRLTDEQKRTRDARPGTLGRDVKFWDAVSQLTPQLKTVVSLLRYSTVADVAEYLSMTEDAVEKARERGIKKMQGILGVDVGKRRRSRVVVSRGEITEQSETQHEIDEFRGSL